MQCVMMYNSKCYLKQGDWESSQRFYKSHNTVFNKYGYFPICKDCIKDYIGDYAMNEDKVVDVCRILDLPFFRTTYKVVNSFSDYLKVIGSSYKDMTFKDSSFEDGDMENITEEDLMMLKLKWGEGFTTSEYLFLSNEFNNMMNDEIIDHIQELYVREICITRLFIQKERAKKGNVKDLIEQLNKLVTMANLKPSTNKTDGKTYSEKIRNIENTRPIILENKELEDVDNFNYFVKYFIKHFRRVLGIDKDEQTD